MYRAHKSIRPVVGRLGHSSEQQKGTHLRARLGVTKTGPQPQKRKQSTKSTGSTTHSTLSTPTPHPHFNTINSPRRNEDYKTFRGSNPNGSNLLVVTQLFLFQQKPHSSTNWVFNFPPHHIVLYLKPVEDGRGHSAFNHTPVILLAHKPALPDKHK